MWGIFRVVQVQTIIDNINRLLGKVAIADTDGTTADVTSVNGYNGLVTIAPAHVSTSNSTSTPLGGGATFTGVSEDVANRGTIVVSVFADVDSATDGLSFEYSSDGTNWDNTDVYTITGGEGKTYTLQTVAQYFRVVYTNGAVAQSAFRLQVVLKPYYVKPSSHRVNDLISPQDDAELVKAVLTAQKPGGDFTPIDATNGGNLKISIEEFDSGASIPAGSNVIGKVYVTDGTDDADVETIDAANLNAKKGLTALSQIYAQTDVDFISRPVRQQQTGRRLFVNHGDGANNSPAMDATARAGYQILTDKTTDSKISITDQAFQVAHLPSRASSNLSANAVTFSHGLVTADYSADNAANKTQSVTYNFYITELTLRVNTDPTSEIAIQPIPLNVRIVDATGGWNIWIGSLGIPNNTHIVFNTPIVIPKGINYRTSVLLGGSTDLNIDVILNGFEDES